VFRVYKICGPKRV